MQEGFSIKPQNPITWILHKLEVTHGNPRLIWIEVGIAWTLLKNPYSFLVDVSELVSLVAWVIFSENDIKANLFEQVFIVLKWSHHQTLTLIVIDTGLFTSRLTKNDIACMSTGLVYIFRFSRASQREHHVVRIFLEVRDSKVTGVPPTEAIDIL